MFALATEALAEVRNALEAYLKQIIHVRKVNMKYN